MTLELGFSQVGVIQDGEQSNRIQKNRESKIREVDVLYFNGRHSSELQLGFFKTYDHVLEAA